jgi:hypothetical protein
VDQAAVAAALLRIIQLLVELEILHQLLLHKEIMVEVEMEAHQDMVLVAAAELAVSVEMELLLWVLMEDQEQHLLFLEHQ